MSNNFPILLVEYMKFTNGLMIVDYPDGRSTVVTKHAINNDYGLSVGLTINFTPTGSKVNVDVEYVAMMENARYDTAVISQEFSKEDHPEGFINFLNDLTTSKLRLPAIDPTVASLYMLFDDKIHGSFPLLETSPFDRDEHTGNLLPIPGNEVNCFYRMDLLDDDPFAFALDSATNKVSNYLYNAAHHECVYVPKPTDFFSQVKKQQQNDKNNIKV